MNKPLNLKTTLKKLYQFICRHHQLILQCILALGIFLLSVYRLSETGQPILFNDEIGYWSNCNLLLRKSWIPVTSRIGYYSYGYSLVLIPVRLLGMFFGWLWYDLYHAGVILNACLLVLSFFLAQKVVKRYMPDMNPYIRIAACFVIFAYPSTMVYAHITWSETTLLTLVWILLYIMMRVIDAPGILNHAAFAAVAFYMYAVHQRALGILAVTALIVLYLRLLKKNSLKHAAAYAGTLYVFYLLHTMLKGYVQNVNYLGGEYSGAGQLIGYIANKRSLLFFTALVALFVLLYLLEKDKALTAGILCLVGVAAAVVWIRQRGGILSGAGAVDVRVSTNDFAGQIGKVKNIFSKNGLIRLGVGITGKWFYMASGSALVVCWSLWVLFKNALALVWHHIKQPFAKISTRDEASDDTVSEGSASRAITVQWNDRIWFLGMFLIWFGTFMISAIYKEGLFKNDDLVNGRYIDFIFGFLMIYGLYCLMKDRYWIISAAVFMGMYRAAGWLCQDILNKLERKEFELAHCILFGRVIWNYEVPYGKINTIVEFVMPVAIAFILLVRLESGEIRSERINRIIPYVRTVRVLIALLIPLVIWGHIGKEVVDNYVVVRNEKQEEPFVNMTNMIRFLGNDDTPVYFLLDYANDRIVGTVQFMLPDRAVQPVWNADTSFDEDAFFIIKSSVMDHDPAIAENCEAVYSGKGYTMLINRHGEIMKTWDFFKDEE